VYSDDDKLYDASNFHEILFEHLKDIEHLAVRFDVSEDADDLSEIPIKDFLRLPALKSFTMVMYDVENACECYFARRLKIRSPCHSRLAA
jgi:hypothetical protein